MFPIGNPLLGESTGTMFDFVGGSSSKSKYSTIVEGSLEVKLPTIWTDEKQSRGEAERRGRLEERR